ncbi:MAG: pilus assembly protein [Deltaproteobacteria bacterium RBG_13_53_10]|nr:MAG: pilus assembly protein [Deltaproteobacteria bacterium RBG_13_53_10]
MEAFVGLGIFLAILVLIEGTYLVARNRLNPEAKQVRQRLKVLSLTDYSGEEVDLVRKKLLSRVPWFNRLLLSFRWTQNLDRLLEQADIRHPLGLFVLLSLLLASGGGLLVAFVTPPLVLPTAMILGLLPFFYIYSKKRKRMRKFERQLPDTMDLIARALKAGHALSGGLQLVGEEFGDPIGTEFERTVNEINFGVAVPDALKSLAERVDCRDLKFFVMSVIIQRETGGNLAEILENIAHLIRERFKFLGRIRILSAEGKLSAIILVAIPFFLAFVLSIINPDYINTLFEDPIGIVLVAFAVVMIVIGILMMRKMVAIRV